MTVDTTRYRISSNPRPGPVDRHKPSYAERATRVMVHKVLLLDQSLQAPVISCLAA